MKYVGIDIAKRRHAAVGIDENGQVVLGARFVGNDAGGYASLAGELRKLGSREDVTIGLEATGHYGNLFVNRLRAEGWAVHLFNPIVTAAAAGGDVRGRKTDKLDALIIARILRDGQRGQVMTTPAEETKLKTLCRQRGFLIGLRTEAKNRLGAFVDTLFPELQGWFHDPCTPTFLAILERFPSAHAVTRANIRSLAAVLRKASQGQLGFEQAVELKKLAGTSLASAQEEDPGAEWAVQQMAVMIRELNAHVASIEKQIQTCQSPIATYLASIKGFGPILPLLVAGELGNLERFAGRHMRQRILAFAGCEPRLRESGKWQGQARTSKRGSRALRAALYHAAQTVHVHSPAFGRIYRAQINRGKHHIVAQFHVIRAIVNTLCGMYKTRTFYTPEPAKGT
jgi:transposase